MKIRFHINYHTVWGETVHISGNTASLGNGDVMKSVAMQLEGPDLWVLTTEIDKEDAAAGFCYTFIIKSDDHAWRFEWGLPHRFKAESDVTFCNIFASWQNEPSDKPYFSSAFVRGMLSRTCPDQPLKAPANTIGLTVEAPMILPDEVLAVAGSIPALGNWNPAQAMILNDSDYPRWKGNIPLRGIEMPFDYKFLILKKDSLEVVEWEASENRRYDIHPTQQGERIEINGLRFANPRMNWKGAGTAIPVFSLRSENDWGVGEFIDLKQMVDWCADTHQSVLQLLPINDTIKTGNWTDSYPYSANSTFALHPMYIHPESVGTLPDKKRRDYFAREGERLNNLPEVDYEAVNNLKHEFLKEIYAEEGKRLLDTKEYRDFEERNKEWLLPYAAWCLLRDMHHTPDNTLWGEYAHYDDDKIKKLIADNKEEIGFFCFTQYHLDKQLREVRDYAHQNRVVLKGDIPIGIGRHSVDAWKSPELFNMNVSAGAPPDDFSVLGQNWGFPTYNWEEMAKDGFAWWKARFRKMAEYFDAYRVDHILGFFRIWQIPLDAVHGLLGYFNPALPFSAEEMRNSYDFWINPDVQTKPLILDWMLGDFFGQYADEARNLFMDRIDAERYRLKPEFDTQLKVKNHFDSIPENERNNKLRDGLIGLIDDVLFIEDPFNKGHYHPRISAQFTYQFRVLTDYEKWCFNRLYNDFFYHRHNDFWYGKAMWKLPPLIDSTGMLCCAEDLGMIPDCVPEVMDRLQILSLEIQRMPKDPKREFGDTWNYPYYSVCTTSTHDMGGIRAWWEEDRQTTQRYFNEILHENGEVPYFAEPWVCSKILDLQLASPSMLCIIPLQDWLSTDGNLRRKMPAEEQINVPANPNHYWRYRMHLTIEKLRKADNFNAELRNRIIGSHR